MRTDSERRMRFEAMFVTHHDAVRRYIVRRQAAPLVDDAIAETFLVAWRRLDEIPDRTLPWLLGVARRVLADQRRAVYRRRSLSERLRIDILTDGLAGDWEPPAALTPELASALAALTEHEREALLLVAWDELSPADAARVAGCSAMAFRVRLHRARRRVADRLGIEGAGRTNATKEKLA
ncbi:MAG: RNA polymerase sigma factor [Solirubrobacterales bacterium]|nr:RNA polymerase sigma factor [Solirubrobacterales bacterium]